MSAIIVSWYEMKRCHTVCKIRKNRNLDNARSVGKYLANLEDVDKWVPLHEQVFSREVSFKQIFLSSSMSFGYQSSWMVLGLVKRYWKLLRGPPSHTERLKSLSKFVGCDKPARLIFSCPVLLLIFPWCHLQWIHSLLTKIMITHKALLIDNRRSYCNKGDEHNCLLYAYFLQKVSHAFSFRALEAHMFKKFKHTFTRPLVHNLAVWKENNVIKEIISLRCWLEKWDDSGAIENVNSMP